jgi:hypothetical protein
MKYLYKFGGDVVKIHTKTINKIPKRKLIKKLNDYKLRNINVI